MLILQRGSQCTSSLVSDTVTLIGSDAVSVDDDMVYTPFKNDHGPLNLAYTFDACVRIYDKINVCSVTLI